ncbi:MAG: Coenzyme F420 hydrogenase/dehydrogenase, beta subunit C-terminal domain [bacterium]
MVDVPNEGRRPVFDRTNRELLAGAGLEFCPGYAVRSQASEQPGAELIGPYLEIWEGYAADPDIRFKGSSGGVLTALSHYCITNGNMYGVLHTAQSEKDPLLNETVLSTTRDELVARTGSRYATSSPCSGLDRVVSAPGPCVFIGKPCDAAAARELTRSRAEFNEKVGVILTFFCAGTPSTGGVRSLVDSISTEASEPTSLRFRGNGWPGHFVVGNGGSRELTYDESWGYLQRYRPFRCQICADGLGELADISCGDAWHRYGEDDPGRSVIVVRTERGRGILSAAIQAGFVHATPSSAELLLSGQGLVSRRKQLHGRLTALRLTRTPATRYEGFELARAWRYLSLGEKIKSIVGTVKRIYRRGIHRPLNKD